MQVQITLSPAVVKVNAPGKLGFHSTKSRLITYPKDQLSLELTILRYTEAEQSIQIKASDKEDKLIVSYPLSEIKLVPCKQHENVDCWVLANDTKAHCHFQPHIHFKNRQVVTKQTTFPCNFVTT
jgi:hypothetical protein